MVKIGGLGASILNAAAEYGSAASKVNRRPTGFNVDDIRLEEIKLRALRGQALDGSERQLLDRWLAAGPANRQEWQSMNESWNALADLTGPPAMTTEDRKRLQSALGARRRAARSLIPLAAVAAAVALFFVPMWTRTHEDIRVGPATTQAAASRTVRLEDGTLALVEQGSALYVVPGSNGREVQLEGRAFFAVARREDHPFRVHTANGVVRVLGTRFDVDAAHDSVQVVVVDGRVELGTATGSVHVNAGERAIGRPGQIPATHPAGDVYALMDWMDGTLVFQSTPVSSVAREITHRYGVDVVIEGSELGRREVTAAFDDQTIEEVVAVICSVIVARCSYDSSGSRITLGQ